jgi:hypothetical protein
MKNILKSCNITKIFILTPLFWFPNGQFVYQKFPNMIWQNDSGDNRSITWYDSTTGDNRSITWYDSTTVVVTDL